MRTKWGFHAVQQQPFFETPPPTCCARTGPGGSPTPTGYGDPNQPPVNTPRIIPEGGEDPAYNPCATGGDPATATDPTDTQSLTNAVSPVVWIRITLPDATVLRYNAQGVNFTSGNGEVSTPRVLSWGSISQTLADDYGSFEAFRTSITLSDADRAIRTHLSNATNRHVDGREAVVYIETRANAAAAVAPRVLGRGVITSWRASTDMDIQLEISDPLGYRYSSVSLDRPFPHRRINANFFPSCPEQNLGRAVPIVYGDYSDDFLWSVNTQLTPIGLIPVIHVGRASDINGLTGDGEAFVICGHAIAGMQSIFGSNLAETAPGSVRLSLAQAEFTLPGIGGALYYDITGADGEVERYCMMTGQGPIVDDHINGVVPITVNVCGLEDVGDGSGDVITNEVSQLQHVIQHMMLDNYFTGNWGAVPTFPASSVPKVNITSFNTCRTTINNRMGGTGYVGAFYIGEQKQTRAWLAELGVGCDLRFGINHQGQLVAVTLDDQASTAGLTTFDTSHIEESLFDIDPRLDNIYNVLEYQSSVGPATGRYPWPATTIRNEESVDLHSERIAEPVTIRTTIIQAYAHDVANRRLAKAAQPIAKVVFKVDLRGLALSLGQLVMLTHFAGIGATGWTQRVVQVTKITTDPNEADGLLCTIEAEDIHDIVSAQQLVLGAGQLGTAVLA